MLWEISNSEKQKILIEAQDFDSALEIARAYDPSYKQGRVFEGCSAIILIDPECADDFVDNVATFFAKDFPGLLLPINRWIPDGFSGFEFWTAHPENIGILMELAPYGTVFTPHPEEGVKL